MKLLTELLNVKRLPQQSYEDEGKDLQRDDLEQEPYLTLDNDMENDMEPDSDDEITDDDDDEFSEEDLEAEEPTDPNRAGLIRTVKGAHLVYKREQDDGTYEEMWIFNTSQFKKDTEVKRAIVSGTDIPTGSSQSPDGSQTIGVWNVGNAQIIVIKGLDR